MRRWCRFKGTPEVINAIRGGQIQAGLDILSPLLAQPGQRVARAGGDRRCAARAARRADSARGGRQGSERRVVERPGGARTHAGRRGGATEQGWRALADAGVRQKLEALNLDPHPGTPQDAAAMLSGDIQRWRRDCAPRSSGNECFQAKMPPALD